MDTFKKSKSKIDSLDGNCKPIMLLGIDGFLKKNFVGELLKHVESKNAKVDYMHMSLSDIDFDYFRNAINVQSLMKSTKLIYITGDQKELAKKFEIKKPKKKKFTYEELILDSIKGAKQNVYLVLDFDALDKRKKIYKDFDANGLLLDIKPMDEKHIIKFCSDYLKANDVSANDNVIKYFLSLIDNDMHNVVSEMVKMINYSDVIDKSVIDLLVTKSAKVAVFDLIDKVADGKIAESLIILSEVMSQGNSPFQVLTLLALHYERLFNVKIFNSYKDYEIAKFIKAPPFIVTKYRVQSEKISYPAIEKAMAKIVETEIKLKSGYNDTASLNMLITDLCGLRRGAKANVRKNSRSRKK